MGFIREQLAAHMESALPLRTPPSLHLTLPPKPQGPTTFPSCREGQNSGLEASAKIQEEERLPGPLYLGRNESLVWS